ncbi:class I SAM-dependent methyltransferase [Nocardia sp. NBC_00511]|uniref:class I SAM-dependent methyltransferase n=1 Tax=Nocardia sp. NBC_00511 TaxID=2903591 RepID=UPI0030E137AD
MQNGGPSRTALGAARYRADHQRLDAARVFADPLAIAVVEPDNDPQGGLTGARTQAGDYLDEDARRRMRMFIAARSRYAEDRLADAYRAGIRQLLILGAGLDTFAYRNPHPGLRVFEIDHPDTQVWKRKRLADTGIEIPGTVSYLAADFERDTLAQVLAAGDVNPEQPAYVMWLGVTVYLTGEAIDATLGTLGGLGPGTELVLDYGVPFTAVTAEQRAAVEVRERRLAAIGERWISYFTPDQMAARLAAAGFTAAEDLSAGAVAARYLGDPSPADRPGPRLVRAVTHRA